MLCLAELPGRTHFAGFTYLWGPKIHQELKSWTQQMDYYIYNIYLLYHEDKLIDQTMTGQTVTHNQVRANI